MSKVNFSSHYSLTQLVLVDHPYDRDLHRESWVLGFVDSEQHKLALFMLINQFKLQTSLVHSFIVDTIEHWFDLIDSFIEATSEGDCLIRIFVVGTGERQFSLILSLLDVNNLIVKGFFVVFRNLQKLDFVWDRWNFTKQHFDGQVRDK